MFHALAALATWQATAGQRFDLLVQVGDMGAFPDPARTDASTQRYLKVDPSEADFSNLLRAQGRRADNIRRLRQQLPGPVHFVRGNHEDFGWLRDLPVDQDSKTARIDPFDALRYAPDGTVLEVDGLRLAFLGGVEELPGEPAIDRNAYRSLMDMGPASFDVLVTHQGPYGISTGYYGNVLGSQLITALVERTRPAFHVAGHVHLSIGPRAYGRTTYLNLASLVASARWDPDARGMLPGCLGILDTRAGTLEPVVEPWLAAFPTAFDAPFDFDTWCDSFLDAVRM